MARSKDSGKTPNRRSDSNTVRKDSGQGRGTEIERRSQPYEGNATRPPRPPKK